MDHMIIQCLDNTAYYSRTEEGGDILVRHYGEFHVEGDLVLASKERRQYLMFECILAAVTGSRNPQHHPGYPWAALH